MLRFFTVTDALGAKALINAFAVTALTGPQPDRLTMPKGCKAVIWGQGFFVLPVQEDLSTVQARVTALTGV